MRCGVAAGPLLELVWSAKERGHRADRGTSAGVSRSRGGPAANDWDHLIADSLARDLIRLARTGKSAAGGCSGPGSPGVASLG